MRLQDPCTLQHKDFGTLCLLGGTGVIPCPDTDKLESKSQIWKNAGTGSQGGVRVGKLQGSK